VNRTIESALRFVNLTTAGLLAGSLGFGEAALVPGWSRRAALERPAQTPPLDIAGYFNAIGPVALGTAVTLAIGAPQPQRPGAAHPRLGISRRTGGRARRDDHGHGADQQGARSAARVGLPSEKSQSMVKNWTPRARRAHDAGHRRVRLRRRRVEHGPSPAK
jgi:hypothetical protein